MPANEFRHLSHPQPDSALQHFLGATLARNGRPAPPEERLWATAATVTASILGGVHIVRVHDVVEMAQVARVGDCLLDPVRCRSFR